MTEMIKPAAEWVAAFVESVGIGLIGAVSLFVVVLFVVRLLRRQSLRSAYEEVRVVLGRGILLGLEFLVAADIVHTVAVELTFQTVGVLAIIVLIRTFLSVTLELELTGRWPWQKDDAAERVAS
jgi:uncharacterized membrane protein